MASFFSKTCICLMAAAMLLLSGCTEEATQTLICDGDSHNSYCDVAEQILPGYDMRQEHKGGLDWLKRGAAVLTYDLLAIPATELGTASYWVPQYNATVIIAVDRSRTDAEITGWNDLLTIRETVGMSDRLTEVRLLMAAMAYGLEGESYTLTEASALLTGLHRQKRLSFHDFDAPVLICFDYQAAALYEEGRSLEIIIPQEGTLTFEAGLLSQSELTISEDTEDLLLAAGFRLPDGRTSSAAYPSEAQYRNAAPPPDYIHLAEVCEDVTYVLKRDVLHISSYLYSSVDGREQQLFALGFIVLVVLWTGYVMRRIMQKNIQRAVLIVVALVIGWVLLRMFKYQIPLGALSQYCWYGYYLFQLGIALAILWMAWMIDRPEDDLRPPRWWAICAVISGLLFLAVMGNNLHHLAFVFSPDDPAYNVNYTYGPLYYVTMAVIFIEIFAAQVFFIRKSWQSPRRRSFLFPILFYSLLGLYGVCYIMRVPLIWETDLTVVSGTFVVIFIEACIRSGLIPVNTKYKALFEHSPLKMQIVGFGGNVILASQTASPVRAGTSYPTLKTPQRADEDTLLYQSAISGGTVLWQQDISSIKQLHREIAEANEKIAAVNAMLIEEERIKSRLAATEARTALFAELEAEIQKKATELGEMIAALPASRDYQRKVACITLLLCYIKRRCILFFRERETDKIALDEIVVYLDELGEFAAFAGIHMHVSAVMCVNLTTRRGTLFYDFVYAQLEWALTHDCRAILVQIMREKDSLVLKVLQPTSMADFVPDSPLLTAAQAAGGNFTIKDMEDATGVWLSFPEVCAANGDASEAAEGGER